MRDIMGPLVALPEETHIEGDYVTIPSIVPLGAVIPLHSHPDRETLVIVEGRLEAWLDGEWRSYGPGEVVEIASDAKHALRNAGPDEVSLVLVTTHRMTSFFKDISTPAADGPQISQDRLIHFLVTAHAYGYWNGGPEDQARIGLAMPTPG